MTSWRRRAGRSARFIRGALDPSSSPASSALPAAIRSPAESRPLSRRRDTTRASSFIGNLGGRPAMRSPGALCVLAGMCAMAPSAYGDDPVLAQEEPATESLGQSQVDLLYTPVTPCRILDTRLAGGAIEAGTTRSFLVTGGDLSAQGGSATGCGIPSGSTAAMINFVAVNPAGAGNLRLTPFGAPMPLAAIVNYAVVPGLNIANGLAVTICDPSTTACVSDFTIQADVRATNLVADVQGYFRNIDTEPRPASSASGVPVPAAGATPVLVTAVSFTAKAFGNVLVRARGHCSIGPAGALEADAIELAIG